MRALLAVTIAALVSPMSVGCDRAPSPIPVQGQGIPDEEDGSIGEDLFIPEGAQPEEDVQTEEDVPPDDTTLPPLPALADCGAEVAWTTPSTGFDIVYGSPALSVAPGEALAARAGGGPLAFHRMTDGAALGAESGGWDEVLDAEWERRMVVVQFGDEAAWAEVSDAQTGEILYTQEALPSPDPELDWFRLMRAFLTPDGKHLATMTCWSRIPADVSLARVQLRDLESGLEGPVVDLDVDCGDNLWPRAAPGALSHDGQTLVLTFAAAPEVFVVDLGAGTALTFDPVGDLPDATPITENWGYGNTAVLSAAIRPDGAALALTDRAGRVTRWSLPHLNPIGAPWDAGLVGINQYTYGPSMESPVAWSPDGTLLAHLDEDGEAVVRRADTGSVALALARPEMAPPDWTGPDLFNPATAFLFTMQGDGVLVSFETGLALWRCPDAPPPEIPGVLKAVSIDGPTTISMYETYTWTTTAETGGQPVVFRLLVDGEPMAGGLRGLLTTSFYDPGLHTLQAVADDGINQAESEMLSIVVQEDGR